MKEMAPDDPVKKLKPKTQSKNANQKKIKKNELIELNGCTSLTKDMIQQKKYSWKVLYESIVDIYPNFKIET